MNDNVNNKQATPIILLILLVLFIIVILSTIIVNSNTKKQEISRYIYHNSKVILKKDNTKVVIKKTKGLECSKKGECDHLDNHIVEVDANNNIYTLSTNKESYVKIKDTNKYLYITIKKGKVVISICRNYNPLEVIVMGKDSAYDGLKNVLEKIKNFNIRHTNYTEN